MKIQLAVSQEGFATTIVAMTTSEDGLGLIVVYTGTHLEGDSTGTIEIDLSSYEKRLRAYDALVKAKEEQIKHLSKALQGYEEAKSTLQSERDANSILTEEIERMRK